MPRDGTWEVPVLCGSELHTNECEDLWVAPAGTPHLSISLRSSHFSPGALRRSGFKAACEAGCAAMHSGKAHEPSAWKGSVCSELKSNSLECGCSLMSVTFLELCSCIFSVAEVVTVLWLLLGVITLCWIRALCSQMASPGRCLTMLSGCSLVALRC